MPTAPRALFGLCLALGLHPAWADEPVRKVESRRDAIEPEALAKLLERGELALVESNPDGSAAQIVLFSRIAAPREQVYDTILDVESYPKFMKSVVKNTIVKRQGPMFAYDWELDVPVFNLKGVRAMRGRRPELIEVRGISGNFADSRERWELYSLDGGKRTLAAFYRSLDVRSAGLILKTMVSMEPSMEHGVNLAAGFVHVRDVRRYIEKLPEPKLRKDTGPLPPFRELALDGAELGALKRLLEHGLLALIESNEEDGSLRQVAMLTVVNASRAQLSAVVNAPGKYPEFIPNLVSQKVTPEEKGGALKLEYELEVPMANLKGVSRMTIEGDGSVDVDAVDGDIKRGHWRWEWHPLSDQQTVPVHYAYSDVTETSWFVKQLIQKQPLFEHGIVVAASTVAMRAMKARAEGTR